MVVPPPPDLFDTLREFSIPAILFEAEGIRIAGDESSELELAAEIWRKRQSFILERAEELILCEHQSVLDYAASELFHIVRSINRLAILVEKQAESIFFEDVSQAIQFKRDLDFEKLHRKRNLAIHFKLKSVARIFRAASCQFSSVAVKCYMAAHSMSDQSLAGHQNDWEAKILHFINSD